MTKKLSNKCATLVVLFFAISFCNTMLFLKTHCKHDYILNIATATDKPKKTKTNEDLTVILTKLCTIFRKVSYPFLLMG